MGMTLTANLKITTDFRKFAKQFRKEVIEEGLDDSLSESISELKEYLLDYITDTAKIDITDKSNINSDKIVDNIPKSMETWIKQLTGADLTKFNSSNSFSELNGSKTVYVNNYTNTKAGFDYPSTRLKMSIGPNETFDQHFFQATNFFNSSTFIFRDSSGNLKVLMNPGIDLRRFVKVVCSTDTGKTSNSQRRFETHKIRRSEAQWALTQKGVEYVQQNFVDLTPTIRELQKGEFDNAVSLLNIATSKSAQIRSTLTDKISSVRSGTTVNNNVLAYNKIVEAIKGMTVKKRITQEKVTFSLVTPLEQLGFESGAKEYADFFTYLETQLSLWKAFESQKWFSALVLKADKIIKEFENIQELEGI